MFPVIVQPDAEAWVIASLEHLSGVTAFAYAAAQLDRAGWLMAHFVQVDARAGRKKAARDLAEQARQVVVSLAGLPWPEGCVSYVQPVEGPAWLADDDGSPRYLARYEIRVHPHRSAAPARAAAS
jgi:hypothetical protein